jgi:hypothetical protein
MFNNIVVTTTTTTTTTTTIALMIYVFCGGIIHYGLLILWGRPRIQKAEDLKVES